MMFRRYEMLIQACSLVFSKFEKMLRLLERALDDEDITTAFYTGSMSQAEKDRTVEHFMKPFRPGMIKPPPQVLLLTLKTGSNNTALTEATCVILYEPWWAPQTETDAIKKAYRLGQKKAVTVYRFVTTNTVEVYESDVKMRKRWGAEQGFSEKADGMDGKVDGLLSEDANKKVSELDGSSNENPMKKRKIAIDSRRDWLTGPIILRRAGY